MLTLSYRDNKIVLHGGDLSKKGCAHVSTVCAGSASVFENLSVFSKLQNLSAVGCRLGCHIRLVLTAG